MNQGSGEWKEVGTDDLETGRVWETRVMVSERELGNWGIADCQGVGARALVSGSMWGVGPL